MTGMDVALESMKYGVDDLDGTIDDSTKIYSMAGGVSNPKIRSNDLQSLIASQGAQPCERNSLYEEI
jgi:aminodeoxyfutalosine synthase